MNVRDSNVFNCIYMYLMNYSPDVIWMLPQTHKTPSHKSARRTSLAFDNIDTRDMAHTLAYLDFKLFRRISVSPPVCVHTCVRTCECVSKGKHAVIIHFKT